MARLPGNLYRISSRNLERRATYNVIQIRIKMCAKQKLMYETLINDRAIPPTPEVLAEIQKTILLCLLFLHFPLCHLKKGLKFGYHML